MAVINTLTPSVFNSAYDIQDYWNTDLLQKLYFEPKGVSKQVQKIALDNPEYSDKIARLKSFVENYDVDTVCDSIIHCFENDTNYYIEKIDLYLILGCGTTTIYSINVDGYDVSVLCMEAVDGKLDDLKMLLAHEYTHFVRKMILKKDIFESSIGERLVTEGIAENYAREVVPGRKDSTYCLVDDETVAWVQENFGEIERRVQASVSGRDLMSDLFYMYAKIDYPVRCGYVYGYYVVNQYLKENNLQIKDILTIDWKTVLN